MLWIADLASSLGRRNNAKSMKKGEGRLTWTIGEVGAMTRTTSVMSALALALGLSYFSASPAVAGPLYDAKVAGWGNELVAASRGFFLPGVGPAPRTPDASREKRRGDACPPQNMTADDPSSRDTGLHASNRTNCMPRTGDR